MTRQAKRAIGFIGLGLMGTPIALKLIDAGHDVSVWGRSPDKLKPALDKGATLAASAAGLAKSAEMVFLCLSNTEAVEAVMFGKDGVAEGLAKDTLLIDHSSIKPDATRAMAGRLKEMRSAHWIDAPVSGGPPGVASKTLVVLCGGDADAFARAEPVIMGYAGRATLLGGSGAGQTTKLLNQAICAVAFVATAEIATLAKRAGLDVTKIPGAIAGGRADSRILQEYFPRMAAGDRERGGRIDSMMKDLNAFAELAATTGSATPMTALAAEFHRILVSRGMGPEDPATIVSLFE